MNSAALENKLRVDFGVNPLFARLRMKKFLSWHKQGEEVLASETQKLIKNKSKPLLDEKLDLFIVLINNRGI